MKVCFSSDGKLLAAACEDKNHTVMVFRWEAGLLRCQARLGAKKALALCFSLDGQELVATGHKHFKVTKTFHRQHRQFNQGFNALVTARSEATYTSPLSYTLAGMVQLVQKTLETLHRREGR